MHCNDIAAILDTHRSARLSAAERATVDAHLTTCGDCAAAWHAQTELLGLRVPRVAATLLERAMLAARVPHTERPRRAWPSFAIGAALVAGAALAGMTIVSLTSSPSEEYPSSTGGEPSAQTHEPAAPAPSPSAEAGAAETGTDTTTSVELVETALSLAPIVRQPPDYPVEALRQRVGGHVQLKFDVTATGNVENVSVVESSDAQFEEPAVRALTNWRYLPRIVAGKRIGVSGIQTIIRWEPPSDTSPPPNQAEMDAKQEAALRAYAAFSEGIEVAVDRLAADNLRGAELQLDQMLAVYPAAGFFHGDLWKFYGYLFTVAGNYDRAIDAYERALASYASNGAQPAMGPWAPLANLYFARHQYDQALNTLVRARAAGSSLRLSPEADALIVKLRALGLTHESLEAAN
jgi:TonB family protein